MSILNRRQMLQSGLEGAGLVGLRAMVTGLPVSFLLKPKLAQADGCGNPSAQYLILSMSSRMFCEPSGLLRRPDR